MLLYIHPDSRMLMKGTLPMSLPAVLNRCKPRPVGKYHNEWTEQDIREAQIIIMDLHWFSGIRSFIELSWKFRSLNTEVIIIAGGISASIFSGQLLKYTAVDFIIRGDGENSLPALIEELYKFDRHVLKKMQGVVSRKFNHSLSCPVNTDILDSSDYRNIDFFPTFKKEILKLHAECRGNPWPVYPYLIVYRGCPNECDGCCGSMEMQRRIFDRQPVIRSAEAVRNDLVYWSKCNEIKFVNIHHDFLSLLSADYSGKILDRNYDLYISYEFTSLPEEQVFKKLLKSFSGGRLEFSLDSNHLSSNKLVQIEQLKKLIELAKKHGKYEVMLHYLKRFAVPGSSYYRALKYLKNATGVRISQADCWWDEDIYPDEKGNCTDEQFFKALANTDKHFMLPIIFRYGSYLHRYFPKMAKRIAAFIEL